MKRIATSVLLAIGILSFASSETRAEVRTITYQDRDGCLEMTNGAARLVIVPENGGRIVHYSAGDGPNFFLGGYQMDIGPELDYPPSHLKVRRRPCSRETLGVQPVSRQNRVLSHTQLGCLSSQTFPDVSIGAYPTTRAAIRFSTAKNSRIKRGICKQTTGLRRKQAAVPTTSSHV